MFRLLLVFLFSIGCCFEANAAAVQSFSQALSYKNVSKSSGGAGSSRVRVNSKPANNSSSSPSNTTPTETHSPETLEVDLSEKTSAKISLYKGDTAVVTVKDDPCCSWKVKYDNSALIYTNKGSLKGLHTFLFKQIKDKTDSTVYFDSINNDDKSVVQNKALFITGK